LDFAQSAFGGFCEPAKGGTGLAMKFQGIKRTFCFIVFFSIGGAALSISLLGREVFLYVRSKGVLESAEEEQVQLEALNTDYDILLRQLETEPNIVNRIAPAILGKNTAGGNSVLSKAESKHLELAREALAESAFGGTNCTKSSWLQRCIDAKRRTILFLSGSFLILISLMWFGPVGRGSASRLWRA